MITLRKLISLKHSTRVRKIMALFKNTEQELLSGTLPDIAYLRGLFTILADDTELPVSVKQKLNRLFTQNGEAERAAGEWRDECVRLLNSARGLLAAYMGMEPADWDMRLPEDTRQVRKTLPDGCCLRVYCDDIRSPFNVGSVFRTAESFGVHEIILSPDTPGPEHPRVRRSAMGAEQHVAWKRGEISHCLTSPKPAACFALETGGIPAKEFSFPKDAIVIIGNEELGVSPRCLQAADNSAGRVGIEMYGRKTSVNVGVAFGIIMYAWRGYVQNV